MSTTLATFDGSATDRDGKGSKLLDHPGEEPQREELEAYLARLTSNLIGMGFGPILRGEMPPSLISLNPRSLAELPPLPAASKKDANTVYQRELFESTLIYQNSKNLEQQTTQLNDHKTRIADYIFVSMEKNSHRRRDRLKSAHVIDLLLNLYDGGAIYRTMMLELKTPVLIQAAKTHEHELQKLMAVKLLPNLSVQTLAKRLSSMDKHVPHLYRPLEGKAHSNELVKMMPEVL